MKELSKTRILFGKCLKFLIGSLLIAVWIFTPNSAQGKFQTINGKTYDIAEPGEYILGQLVVKAKTKRAEKEIYRLAQTLGAYILHENPRASMYLFEFSDDPSAQNALEKIRKEQSSMYRAYPNWKMSIPKPPEKKVKGTPSLSTDEEITPQHFTNDPGFDASWWIWKIKEPWAGNPTSNDPGIAILDTGVDYTHSELQGKVVKCFDYIDWDNDPMDLQGHGTHCAGIAAAIANNHSGIHGVSPQSDIYAYRVLDRYGSGGMYQIIDAVYDAADNLGVKGISMSLRGIYEEGSSGWNDWSDAVDYARNTKGKIVCAAAGNDYNFYNYYYKYYFSANYFPTPGFIDDSFCVGATQHFDYRAEFSNYDVNTTSSDGTVTYDWNRVDIVAPGVDILSTLPEETYDRWGGTSMATPIIAGCCARVWGKYPGQTAGWVENKLITTGAKVGTSKGFPLAEYRVDLMKAFGVSNTGLMGIVRDAESGFPLDGIKVQAVTIPGNHVHATSYSKNGFFSLVGLKAGQKYRVKAININYKTRNFFAGTTTGGIIKDLWKPLFLPPKRGSTTSYENWRIVCMWKSTHPGYGFWNWGSSYSTWFPYRWYQPAGMEANAYLKDPDGDVYYYGKTGSLYGSPYVKFMHDSYWDSNAPFESFVIQDAESGVYSLVIKCEKADYGWGSINFSQGGVHHAQLPNVMIYKGNQGKKFITSSNATQDGSGTLYWYVCDIDTTTDTITVINQITDTWPL